MHLYLTESGSTLKKQGGKILVEKDHKIVASYPVQSISAVTLHISCQITSQCLAELLEQNVRISWIAASGKMVGCLSSPTKEDILRQRKQFELLNLDNKRLQFAKEWISAKIHNGRAVLQRCSRENDRLDMTDEIASLKRLENLAAQAETLEMLEGYEGMAARDYYGGMRFVVPDSFGFTVRTKHPPRDCFSALLSFLYSLLFNEMYNIIVHTGLHPFVGVMHQLKDGHPALVSDLMEEWRAVLSDRIALTFATSNQLTKDSFSFLDNGSVYLNRAAANKVIERFEKRLTMQCDYVCKNGVGQDYRGAITAQVYSFIRALQEGDAGIYKAVRIK